MRRKKQIDENTKLSSQELAFVAGIVEGKTPADAYEAAFANKVLANRNSLRAMASYTLRQPHIKKAINDEMDAQRAQAMQTAQWNAQASALARMASLNSLKQDLERRGEGLKQEIAGIEADELLSDAQKEQAIGKAKQRRLFGKDELSAQNAVFESLDRLAGLQRTPSISANIDSPGGVQVIIKDDMWNSCDDWGANGEYYGNDEEIYERLKQAYERGLAGKTDGLELVKKENQNGRYYYENRQTGAFVRWVESNVWETNENSPGEVTNISINDPRTKHK